MDNLTSAAYNENEFKQKVRNLEKVTLGHARRYASTSLSENETKHPCCFVARGVCPEDGPSAFKCCRYSSNYKYCCTINHCSIDLCCCINYGCCFAVCKNDHYPGTYTCTDLKGVTYTYMALGDNKWGWWGSSSLSNHRMEDDEITCYCLREL